MCHNVNSHVFFQNKSFSKFSDHVALFVTVLSLTGQNKLNFTIIMYNSPTDLEKSENTYHRINQWGNLFKLLLLLMLPYRANRGEGVLYRRPLSFSHNKLCDQGKLLKVFAA